MSVQSFFILTDDERAEAEAFNTDDLQLGPRIIDAVTPGVGLNLNPDAVNYAPGEAVSLSGGKYVATQTLISNPDYMANVPKMLAYLLALPWITVDTATIFVPAHGPGG